MIRVVFDTSVLVQAAGRPAGPSAQCMEAVWSGVAELFISPMGYQEVAAALGRPRVRGSFRTLSDDDVYTFLAELRLVTRIVRSPLPAFSLPRDPNDEHVIGLALAANCHFLVSRDSDILALANQSAALTRQLARLSPNLRVVDPVQFLTVLAAGDAKDLP